MSEAERKREEKIVRKFYYFSDRLRDLSVQLLIPCDERWAKSKPWMEGDAATREENWKWKWNESKFDLTSQISEIIANIFRACD